MRDGHREHVRLRVTIATVADPATMLLNVENKQPKQELHSSLTLQMALHYNAYFLPFHFVSSFSCLVLKYSRLPSTYQVILAAVYLVYYVVELTRLLLGYYGNLGEKIPALSGFWITSLILQLPITLFLQINSAILPLPLERAVFGCHSIFLLVQITSGFQVIRTIAAYQVRYFMSLLEEERRKSQ